LEAGLRILFIHGAGAQDTDDSSQPLLRRLWDALPRGTIVDAPVMPDPDHPDAAAWGEAVREHMAAIDEDFVAVGHSLGGSTILREISEHGAPARLRGVVTMAMPFWNAPDWRVPDYAVPEEAGPLKDVPLILYASTDDETVAIDHLDRYAAVLPDALLRRVSGTDHLFDRAPFDAIAEDIVSLFGGRR
jgi:hypothetical protein